MVLSKFKSAKKQLAVLIDPDKVNHNELVDIVAKIEAAGASYIFIGGSLLFSSLNESIKQLKKHTKLPVVIFPGGAQHVSPHADAILFLSLVSGRNPEFLIGQQVASAPIIRQAKLESVSVGYVLIDGGCETTVSYMSNTKPIPPNKPEIAAATCMAAEMIGMHSLYLEAGSGAKNHVPPQLIQKVKQNVSIPVIVGGGIKNGKQLASVFEAGADIAVIGTALEQNFELIEEFSAVLSATNR